MTFWYIVGGFFAVTFIIGAVYLTSRFSRFCFVDRLGGGKKWAKILISFVIVALIALVSYQTMGLMNAVLVVLHLMIFWLLCDLIFFVIRKRRGIEKNGFKKYWAGGLAIFVTVCYLGVGAFLAHNVWQNDYRLSTYKFEGTLRVAMFADSHVGATFHAEGFAEHMEELKKCEPHVLIIAGDFVDDDTTKEDMVGCCAALGQFKTRYGTYFVFGNHDKGYYDFRNFSEADLIAELEKNNVTILRDEAVLLGDMFYVIGRRDKSESTDTAPRKEMDELVRGLDKNKYMIVADHQPTDYEAQAASGVDLVLSGHTHGGQLIGMNWAMELLGENDLLKGIKTIGKTHFIVTSGISDWAIKFKTGCKSEVVVVDIVGALK